MKFEFYRNFIDGLTGITDSIAAGRFRRGQWHPEPPADQVKYNQLLAGLSSEQRELIAELLVEERSSAIHDALTFIQDNEIKLSDSEGESFSESPYGTDLSYDYVCRLKGDPWPQG